MLGCAPGPGLHMLGRALHSGLHIEVASVLVHHGVVCRFSTKKTPILVLINKKRKTNNYNKELDLIIKKQILDNENTAEFQKYWPLLLSD